jgi:hypothetical protein
MDPNKSRTHCSGLKAGISLRKACSVARQLDCRVRGVRRTGELLVSHPRLQKMIRVNARRKDRPRSLLVTLRQVAKAA